MTKKTSDSILERVKNMRNSGEKFIPAPLSKGLKKSFIIIDRASKWSAYILKHARWIVKAATA